MLKLDQSSSLLDVGCGQGVLGRAVDSEMKYVGVDISKSLIAYAKELDEGVEHSYVVGNGENLRQEELFTHVSCVLALQNMQRQDRVISNMAASLEQNGRLVIVLNHPAFRIPRQSGWGEHPNKIQYRYVNRYLEPLEIPITMHPSQEKSGLTWSYHVPISYYSQALASAGLVIELIEEWTSDKQSEGRAAKMENRARAEIPLFMAIVAVKR